MSLFQCENCGCCENTALSAQGFQGFMAQYFDWSGLEQLKGKRLCSACGPTQYRDGEPTKFGRWHDEFTRVYLPMGMFITNDRGDLAHVETGATDFLAYAIDRESAQ